MTKKQEKNQRLYELRKKSAGWAVFWSLLITGAGHLYLGNGKAGKGLLLLLIQILLWFVALGWIIWIIAPIEAYKDAKKVNKQIMYELDLIDEM